MPRPVYLDYNATTPVKPAVVDAMAAALAETGNASSVHRFGRLARRGIESAREAVAALVNAEPRQVVFTSGGTEANNLALASADRRILVSAIEHDSILKAAPGAELIPVNGDGVLDLQALETMLTRDPRPALVAAMLANNETGAIQPIGRVAEIAHAYGALLHCDAVQAAGKLAIDMKALGVDSLAVSAHKLGGPQGIGALIVADRVPLHALLKGGGQERGWRAGTENTPAIRGFGVAAKLAAVELQAMQSLAALRDDMEARLRRVTPEMSILAAKIGRLSNTSCIALPGVTAETLVMALDLQGIAVSAGSACSSGKVKPSHVLRAMGATPELAAGAIRISLGWRSEAQDIDDLVAAWTAFAARMGAARVAGHSPAA